MRAWYLLSYTASELHYSMPIDCRQSWTRHSSFLLMEGICHLHHTVHEYGSCHLQYHLDYFPRWPTFYIYCVGYDPRLHQPTTAQIEMGNDVHYPQYAVHCLLSHPHIGHDGIQAQQHSFHFRRVKHPDTIREVAIGCLCGSRCWSAWAWAWSRLFRAIYILTHSSRAPTSTPGRIQYRCRGLRTYLLGTRLRLQSGAECFMMLVIPHPRSRQIISSMQTLIIINLPRPQI